MSVAMDVSPINDDRIIFLGTGIMTKCHILYKREFINSWKDRCYEDIQILYQIARRSVYAGLESMTLCSYMKT